MCTTTHEGAVHCERCDEVLEYLRRQKIACPFSRRTSCQLCPDSKSSNMYIKGGYIGDGVKKATTSWKRCGVCNENLGGSGGNAMMVDVEHINSSLEELIVYMPKELSIKGHAVRTKYIPAAAAVTVMETQDIVMTEASATAQHQGDLSSNMRLNMEEEITCALEKLEAVDLWVDDYMIDVNL